MTTISEKDSNQSTNSDSEASFNGFYFCQKCHVCFESGFAHHHHILHHIEREYPLVSLKRLDSSVFQGLLEKNFAIIEKPKPNEKLKLKIHRVVGTNGHKIYQVSAKETIRENNMEEQAVNNREEVVTSPDYEEPDEGLASEGGGKIMDSSKESSRESVNSTPISNGSKDGQEDSSTNLAQTAADDDDEENNTGDSGVSSPGESKKDAKEVKREPVDPPKSPTGSDISDAPTEAVQQQPTLRVRRSDDLCERGVFENIDKLVQQPKQEVGDELYVCSVCPERFSSGTALEAHMSRTGHYSVSAHPDQPQTAQGPMQQLAQQVQRIPASFNSQPYRPDQSVPPSQMYGQNSYPQRINMLGPQVKLTAVGQSAPPQPSPLPNLPPGIQLQKRPAQQNLDNSQPKQRREDIPTNPSVKLPSSITLVKQTNSAPKKPDNTVADILANRGITMIPSGGKTLPGAVSRVPISPGSTSQLNSSVSITPSARSQQQAYSGRGLPTVDLTSDPDPASHHPIQQSSHLAQQAQRMRNRAPPGLTPPHVPHGRGPIRVSCQVCDKVFNSQEALNQHIPSHRGIHNKLPFECKECTAQYPTAQGLAAHKQKYHKTTSSAIYDLAIPVVDLKQAVVIQKLTALGIRNFIPLVQLHNQQNTGQFGLPIVSVELAQNPAFCNISGLGASNLLPLGPLKSILPQ